jgi:hypothetical protein
MQGRLRGGFCTLCDPKFTAFRDVTRHRFQRILGSAMPLKTETPARKLPLNRIFSISALAIALCALVLAMRKPQPVAAPQPRHAMAANAQSFQVKADQLATPATEVQGENEVHLTAPEISAAIAKSAGTLPDPGAAPSASLPTSAQVAEATAAMNESDGAPNVGEPVVTFEGDLMKGQFVTELGGKKVYITVRGHLGAKDGYATFEPTEFKVGDLNVPVSLVNDALQKKMLEQRDKLKLPDYVSDVKVENGELVVTKK